MTFGKLLREVADRVIDIRAVADMLVEIHVTLRGEMRRFGDQAVRLLEFQSRMPGLRSAVHIPHLADI